MIGQATAALERPPRRWVQRVWGVPYIQRRQDWAVAWPRLASLPRSGIRLLDAGCGPGAWTLEVAARRPGWEVVGLDRGAVDAPRAAAVRLRLSNVTFHQGDFLDFVPADRFDVVLSVFSAHYLFKAGQGAELFHRFRRWLAPGGSLVLLGPRREGAIPFAPWLPRPDLEYVLSDDDLVDACAVSGLKVDSLTGSIGRLGTMVKQLDCLARGPFRRVVLTGLYPVQCALAVLDEHGPARPRGRSFAWLLIARAPGTPAGHA